MPEPQKTEISVVILPYSYSQLCGSQIPENSIIKMEVLEVRESGMLAWKSLKLKTIRILIMIQ